MTPAVRISISGPRDSLPDSVFGRWWWTARTDSDDACGFARTEAKARRKAERSAARIVRRAAKKPPVMDIEYTIEVKP